VKETHDHEVFEKADYSATGRSGKEFEDCAFKNCNFSNADLAKSRFIDCTLIDCNLSNAKISNTGLQNVTFLSCKIVGVDFSTCLPFLFEVRFDACSLDYSKFIKNKMKKTNFKECSIREAVFIEADLTGACFDNCDLSNTVFTRANLNQADFRTSRNYSINLEMNTVRKAKFSTSGITGLLSQYDILIE